MKNNINRILFCKIYDSRLCYVFIHISMLQLPPTQVVSHVLCKQFSHCTYIRVLGTLTFFRETLFWAFWPTTSPSSSSYTGRPFDKTNCYTGGKENSVKLWKNRVCRPFLTTTVTRYGHAGNVIFFYAKCTRFLYTHTTGHNIARTL